MLFLTAEDKVSGLTLGGDDYVTKPFSLEEVVARIRAVLRRSGSGDGTGARGCPSPISSSTNSHDAWKAGKAVELSPTEFAVLRYFLQNPGRMLLPFAGPSA